MKIIGSIVISIFEVLLCLVIEVILILFPEVNILYVIVALTVLL